MKRGKQECQENSVSKSRDDWQSNDEIGNKAEINKHDWLIRNTIRSMGYQRFSHHQDEDDISQTVALKIVQASKKGQMDNVENESGWVYQLTKNSVFKMVARETAQKRSVNREVSSNDEKFETVPLQHDHVREVDLQIDLDGSLSGQDREIAEYVLKGYPQTKIAEIFEVDSRTVRRWIKRIRKDLQFLRN